MATDYVGNVKEKGALGFVLEAGFAAKTALFGDARDGEGLAGKTRAENVELGGDVLFGKLFGDVAERHFTEVGEVGLLCEFVPLGGKDAFPAVGLHGDAESAHARKEVNEGLARSHRSGERECPAQ